jgi:integrase
MTSVSDNASVTFTAKFVTSAKPRRNGTGASEYTEYRDAISPLRLAVQPSGVRSLIVRYRRPDDGKSAKLTLRTTTSLAAARHAAAAAMLKLEQGIDPSPRRLPAVSNSSPRAADTIEATAASFLDLHARRKNRSSTASAAGRIFNRLVLPAWRGRNVQDVRRRDVIDLIESIAAESGGYMANRTLGVLSKFFNWLVARDRLTVSPAAGVERPHQEQARDRILADEELTALWRACEGDEPFGPALRLMILSGGRRNEVSQMTWTELDHERRVWTLPRERSKNGREHKMPLPSQAWDILDAVPRLAGSDYVFTIDGLRPIAGWAKAKTRLSMRAGLVEDSWRLHDLRRSAASGMQRLGVSVPIIEKALNHISGTFRGIVGVYQTHDYADEVRIALQKWADHIEQLVGGKPAQVVKLRSKR